MEQCLREEHRSALSQVQSQLQQAQQVAAGARREADTLKAQLESSNRQVLGLHERLAYCCLCCGKHTHARKELVPRLGAHLLLSSRWPLSRREPAPCGRVLLQAGELIQY